MIESGDEHNKSFFTDGEAMSSQLHGPNLTCTWTIRALGKHGDDSLKPYESSEIPGLHKAGISNDLCAFFYTHPCCIDFIKQSW